MVPVATIIRRRKRRRKKKKRMVTEEFTTHTSHVLDGEFLIEIFVKWTAGVTGYENDDPVNGTPIIDWSTKRYTDWALCDPRTNLEKNSRAIYYSTFGEIPIQDNRISSDPANLRWNRINKPTSDQLIASGVSLNAISFLDRS